MISIRGFSNRVRNLISARTFLQQRLKRLGRRVSMSVNSNTGDIKPLEKSEESVLQIKDWRGKLPTNPRIVPKHRDPSSIKLIVVHTTDADWTIEELNQYDINPNHISSKGAPGASTYHEVLTKDNILNILVSPDVVTWHAGGYNRKSYAIALMYVATIPGKPNENYPLPEGMLTNLERALLRLCLRWKLDPADAVRGHRELHGTGFIFVKGHKRLRKTCPGLQLDLDQLRANVIRRMQVIFAAKNLYPSDLIDGISGPKFRRALRLYKEVGYLDVEEADS